ncbi:MAG: hypothetical protein MJ094_09390 [Saccharofermentans sp.]|nr:hypothetical protein [Saccharofermentans sp.]
MRKISKKYLGKEEAKRGAMLVTILFIVAIAIVFISTAMMISMATRGRLYTNAVSDQARLTLQSLTQTVWQAIYSQEINDDQLRNLAATQAVLAFDLDSVPGMGGHSNTSATASFWTPYTEQENDAQKALYCSKIYIEFEVCIDNNSECYLMVLEKNHDEPASGNPFNFAVELTGSGASELNSVVVGYTADNKSDRTGHTASTATDNITFLHGVRMNTVDGFGWYTHLITDSILKAQDSVFGLDALFVGNEAGLYIGNSGGQMLSSDGTRNANFYFYGTNAPFYSSLPTATQAAVAASGTPTFTFYGGNFTFERFSNDIVNSINRYYASITPEGATPRTVSAGYGSFANTLNFSDPSKLSNIRNMYVDSSVPSINWGHTTTSYDVTTRDDSRVPNTYINYAIPDDSRIDTLPEAISTYHLDTAISQASATNRRVTFNDLRTLAVHKTADGYVKAGCYTITDSTLTGDLNVDVGTGSVYFYLSGGLTLNANSHIFIRNSGAGATDSYGRPAALYLILPEGKCLTINRSSGIVDLACFVGEAYTDCSKLDQTKTPACYVFSMGSAGAPVYQDSQGNNITTQLYWNGDGDCQLTAYVGFYPTAAGANDAACVTYRAADSNSIIFYGRMCVGGIVKQAGNFIYLPYCPMVRTVPTDSSRPYRDGTDYSVVTSESGFFTYTPAA